MKASMSRAWTFGMKKRSLAGSALALLALAGASMQTPAQSISTPYAFTNLAGLPGVAGSTDGTGSGARFNWPVGVAVDSAGNVYVADSANDTIRKATPGGMVTTLAGLAGNQGSADGTGNTAQFNKPNGVAVDSAGNLYIADYGNNTIREVTAAGVVRTLAGLAGSQGSADGTGSGARFNAPAGVAVDSAGNIYVADQQNDTLRKITPPGGLRRWPGWPGIRAARTAPGAERASGNRPAWRRTARVTFMWRISSTRPYARSRPRGW